MAENEAKTATLGWATMDVATRWPGWADYKAAADNMKNAIGEATDAKAPIKDHIKRELVKKGEIKQEENIDFQVAGGKVRIIKLRAEKKMRAKGKNLF
jgi:hypothetical protein